MDLTPQVINEVEFSMARRGYDPDQVDEFLEKVAVAVGELSDRLAEARERATMAERRAADAERRMSERPERVVEPETPSPTVSAAAEAELETLKRTLVLAQRTADAAIREAQEEAAKRVASADEEAKRRVTAAEADARAAHEATSRRLLQEVAGLESARDTLRDDVQAFERYLDDQRAHLRDAIGELQRLLDDPERLRAAPPPPARPYEAPSVSSVEPPNAELPSGDTERGIETAAPPTSWGDDSDEGGPPTAPVPRFEVPDPPPIDEAVDAGGDAYLAELRKAMLDDTGAPDAGAAGLFDDDDDDRGARSRFGRRR